MIPALTNCSKSVTLYYEFTKALKAEGFEGDINLDYANRTALSTDNSIYQVFPQGVLYPRNIADLQRITRLCSTQPYHSIVISPRGGGTGTNAQSLTDGLVVDTSKYLNKILEINVEEAWARVECGVVKDQLNAAVKQHGLFFAPELSTSNRATIGGMINTDASGQGSCLYGKTRDHVLELQTVLMDGSVLETTPLNDIQLADAKSMTGISGKAHQLADNIHSKYHQSIEQIFPSLNRCLTGYDLAHIKTANGHFDLNSLLCGSEGTLGFIAEAKIRLLPIPEYVALVNVNYADFDSALRDATAIMSLQPTSIETIDDLILSLAQADNIWSVVGKFFPQPGSDQQSRGGGVNFVEFTAGSELELHQKLQPFLNQLESGKFPRSLSYTVAYQDEVDSIWAMRKKAVGILGSVKGESRPVAFVEDTCVPPESLADYIAEFRALLDGYNLKYGMFGHVDAGVLHVRPMLDMKQSNDERLVRTLSDQVVALTEKYHGLLWGEHGKGVRSEYAPRAFGPLYPLLQRIKNTFDPHNQLNPGKIATPNNEIPLLAIDGVSTRGQFDKTIDAGSWQTFQEGMHCNGNGVCHNWNPNEAMCPSWKITRKRTHTPKGRASLMREWLRQLTMNGNNAAEALAQQQSQIGIHFFLTLPKKLYNTFFTNSQEDFSSQVHESMLACLACKSCTGSCPIHVDIPELRSKFFALYYSRFLRPLKDYAVASLEYVLPLASKIPRVFNAVMAFTPCAWFLEKVVGLTDIPALSPVNFNQALNARNIKLATPNTLQNLTEDEKQQSVILVLDAFTRFYETHLVLDCLDVLQQLGFKPWVAPYQPNGKPLHVHGFRRTFYKVATKTSATLYELARTTIPLVGY